VLGFLIERNEMSIDDNEMLLNAAVEAEYKSEKKNFRKQMIISMINGMGRRGIVDGECLGEIWDFANRLMKLEYPEK